MRGQRALSCAVVGLVVLGAIVAPGLSVFSLGSGAASRNPAEALPRWHPIPASSAINGTSVVENAPVPVWDEQIGLTLTEAVSSLAYNVTAVAQTDSDGYGPGYLVNGLTSTGAWYQVGLSYHWPYTVFGIGSYESGFGMNYESFNSNGDSIFPSNGGGGIASFSGPVNQGDMVLLTLAFSGQGVVMSAHDWNTGADAVATYINQGGATSFVGGDANSNGFFTGLMTEWWHSGTYSGNEYPVAYTNFASPIQSAWMWADEWEPSTGALLFSASTSSPTVFSIASLSEGFSSNGITAYSSGYQFVTGQMDVVPITVGYNVIGGGGGYSSPTLTYSFDGVTSTVPYSVSPYSFYVDYGSSWSLSNELAGSSQVERWQTAQQDGGVVTSSQTYAATYYHQYSITVSYSIAGGGAPTAPTFTFTAFGATSSMSLSGNLQVFWADSGPYSLTNPLPGSTSTERWFTTNGQGTVTGSGTLSVAYSHQYLLTIEGAQAQSQSQWYNSGTSVNISEPGIFGRSQGTGQRLASYEIDGGAPTAIAPSTGEVTVSIVMDNAHSFMFNSITQYEVTLDSSSTQALSSITSPSILGDSYWYDSGSPVRVSLNGVWGRASGTGMRLVSYSVGGGAPIPESTTGSVNVLDLAAIASPQSITSETTIQYQLNTTSQGSIVSLTLPSIPGDTGWYDNGTLVVVNYNYSWSILPGQSRLNAVGYSLDGGSMTAVSRQGNGTFPVSVMIDKPRSLGVDSVTQYQLTTEGGFNVQYSTKSPTLDSFYDDNSNLTVTSEYTWGVVANQSRQNLVGFSLDSQAMNIPSNDSGTFTTPQIEFNTFHTLTFESVEQYFVKFSFSDATGSTTIIPATLAIRIGNASAQTVPGFKLWMDSGTSFVIASVLWEGVDVKPANLSPYRVVLGLAPSINARVYNAQLRVTDYLGQAVPGAQTTILLANGTAVTRSSGPDGQVVLPEIPLGTFTATVQNLGTSTEVVGDASLHPVTNVKVALSYPTLALAAAVLAAIVVAALMLRRRRFASAGALRMPENEAAPIA